MSWLSTTNNVINLALLSAGAGITLPPQNNDGDVVKYAHDGGVDVNSAMVSVKNALAGFGVISKVGVEQVWHRKVPMSLVQPHGYLPSLTTLVLRLRLPTGARVLHFGREVAGTSNDGDDEEELVKVYTDSLTATTSECENGTGGGDDMRKRPLGGRGNLSSKLVEYTRGTMGVR